MSSEVCPFCGKPFKRLKSHLPHCKAADRSKTPPAQHDGTAGQRTSALLPPSSQLTSELSEKTPKSKKSTSKLSSTISQQAKKSKVSASVPLSESTPPAAPLKSVNTPSLSSSSSSSSPSSTSLSGSTRTKKQKLADKIKMAASSAASISSSPSPPVSPILPKSKKKSLRALIEAVKSNAVPEGPLKGTKSTSQDLLSVPPLAADPLTSKRPAPTGTRTNPDKDPDIQPALLSTDTKHEGTTKKKAAQREKALQSLSATEASSVSQDPKREYLRNSARLNGRDNFWDDSNRKSEDLFGNERVWRSGNGHQTRITLQDVKATLGRSNASRQSSKPSILGQIETTDNLPSTPETSGPLSIRLSQVSVPALNQNERGVSQLLTPAAQSEQSQTSTSSQDMELPSVKGESPKSVAESKQAPLIQPQDDGPTQAKSASLLSPVTPLYSGPPSSLVSPAAPSLNSGNHKMGVLSGSPSVTKLMERETPAHASPSSSVPRSFLPSSHTLPVRAQTARANEKPRMEIGEQHIADNGIRGALTHRSLGQVRLRELPQWLVLKTPSHPREIPEMLQRGWQWYYRRYIDVRKGGIGGVGMLLAGYCVLSYVWSYPHIKRDRWRKYH